MLHGPWTSEEGCEIFEVRYAATELLTGAQGSAGHTRDPAQQQAVGRSHEVAVERRGVHGAEHEQERKGNRCQN